MTNRDAEQAQLVWFRSGGGHYLDQTTNQDRSRTPIYTNDVNEAVQTLTREGWKEVHRTGDAEGILVTLRRTARPATNPAAPAPAVPAPPPAPPPLSSPITIPAGTRKFGITRSMKNLMQEGVEYAALYWSRPQGTYSIDYYDRSSYRSESGGPADLNAVRHTFISQGWTMTYATGDGEGVISYFERPAAG